MSSYRTLVVYLLFSCLVFVGLKAFAIECIKSGSDYSFDYTSSDKKKMRFYFINQEECTKQMAQAQAGEKSLCSCAPKGNIAGMLLTGALATAEYYELHCRSYDSADKLVKDIYSKKYSNPYECHYFAQKTQSEMSKQSHPVRPVNNCVQTAVTTIEPSTANP